MINKRYDDNTTLVIALKNGDMDTFNHIYDEYFNPLVSYAQRIVYSKTIAQDIVQEAYIKLWENRQRFKVSPLAYLYRSVYNSSINNTAHKKVIDNYERLHLKDFYYQNVIQRPEAELNMINGDFVRMFQEAKDKLPERCRLIFDLSRYEGLTNREIAIRLEISEKSVENQMTIAIRKLKTELRDILDEVYLFIFL